MSELVLTLRQPAQVGDRARSDFVLGTQDYLPGTVVRGAFAAAWIVVHGEPVPSLPLRAQFLRLFEGGVRYGPLFCGAQFKALSVLGHKYQPGDRCAVAEYDRALQDNSPERCPDCGSPLEQAKGLDDDSVRVRRRTSVAITPSGVARRGQIVTRDTLEAGQLFRGTLVASSPDLLDALSRISPVRVGGRRTTHGMAEAAIGRGSEPPTAQRRADGLLVLRLRSPGIFVDDQGRPSRDPAASELADVLGSPSRVLRRWSRWQSVGGWHVASGLPKPVELAAAPGSTYLIETERAVTDDALAVLGRRGLGLRRHEGFGDLAPPPALRPGKLARDAEARRRKNLLDAVAPLRGVQVRQPELWRPLLTRLAAHADGDQAATEYLRRMAGQPPDPGTGAALSYFLGLSAADAGFVAGELSRQ
jgi:CRISPR-associated protein Csx10